MKKLLIIAALLMATSTAYAGDRSCLATVVVGPEWTTVGDYCRFKTASKLGKRILRICPDGSKCSIGLALDDQRKDHRTDNQFIMTITKWPEGGVRRADTSGQVAPPVLSPKLDMWGRPELYPDWPDPRAGNVIGPNHF